jgi:hypothetical protein
VAEGVLAPAAQRRGKLGKRRCGVQSRVAWWGQLGPPSIGTISALQTKHRIALNRSFINEPYDAL